VLPTVEVFKGFQRERRLVAPAVTASKIITQLVLGDVEHDRTCSCHELRAPPYRRPGSLPSDVTGAARSPNGRS
jgi:hypothetical protein